MVSLGTVAVSALVSGLLAALISSHLNFQHSDNELKRDVLRRLVGNRAALLEPSADVTKEPFIALNEIFVVYADHPEVISKTQIAEQTSIGRIPKKGISRCPFPHNCLT